MKNSPETSYVAAAFLPTISQRAHQSLSNATTPELGMILQAIREQACLHIAKGTQGIAKPTQWVYQAIQEWERINAKLVSSL